jgi:hypothetical protein
MKSFDATVALASACLLALGPSCTGIHPIHRPPTPAEIRKINSFEVPIYVEPLPTTDWGHDPWEVDRVVSADAEKIMITRDDGAPFAVRLDDVLRLRLHRTGRGAVIGALVGGGFGGIGTLFGLLLVNGSQYRSPDAPPDSYAAPMRQFLEVTAISAVVAAAVGALIGAGVGSPEEFPLNLGPSQRLRYHSSPQIAPPAFVGSSTRVTKRAAIVVAPSAEVRSAPFKVAPVIATLARGQRLNVASIPNEGWRVTYLWDGRVGYVQDAQVEVESP